MQAEDFLGQTLAALQDIVAVELYGDLRSDRKREFAACAARILARMRTDLEFATSLATDRLAKWQQLNYGTATIDVARAPLQALHANADCIGRTLDLRSSDPGFLRELGNENSDSASWFRRVVTAARDYLDAYEEAVPRASNALQAASADPETIRERLTRYLLDRFPALPANPIRSFRIVPGGRGKETSLFELAPNDALPTRLVLRRDLAGSVTGTAVFAEFPLLQKVASLGLPVPQPIAAEKDARILGGSFIIVGEVMDAERGGELFAELSDLGRLDASFGPDLIRALALLHSVTEHPSGNELGGHASGGSDPLDMVRGFQHLWRSIVRKPAMHVATDLGFAWLLAHPLSADRPRRLVHGDIGLHNVMVRQGKLAAILDWELTHLGDPAEDLAYAWSPLLRHLMSREEFVRLYTQNGGDANAQNAQAVAWYRVWAHTRNSVYVAMHYDWAASGQRKDIECFNAGIDFFARTQHYIARELDEALSGSSC